MLLSVVDVCVHRGHAVLYRFLLVADTIIVFCIIVWDQAYHQHHRQHSYCRSVQRYYRIGISIIIISAVTVSLLPSSVFLMLMLLHVLSSFEILFSLTSVMTTISTLRIHLLLFFLWTVTIVDTVTNQLCVSLDLHVFC